MKKILTVFPLLLALVLSGCGAQQMAESIPTAAPQMAEDIFTAPPEATPLPTKPVQDTGSSVSIAGDVQQDEAGYYLAYDGGEMHLLLRMCFADLTDKDIGIHLYVDGQPQPYCTEEQPEIEYMHTFPTGNGG